jgi:glycosyltransferase involved in cell wall biosynthesis
VSAASNSFEGRVGYELLSDYCKSEIGEAENVSCHFDTPGGRVKILHVIASADPRSGGPIEGILQQERGFAGKAKGEIVTLDDPAAPFLSDFPMVIHALGHNALNGKSQVLFLRYKFSFKYILWLARNSSKYDAIVVHGLWNFTVHAAAMILPLMARDKYFVYPHGMMDPWFAKHSPLKHKAKRVSWLFFEGRLLAGAKAVFFTAEAERDLARGQFIGQEYHERVVGYGTSEPPAASGEQRKAFAVATPDLGGRRYLLFLSRIHPKKGCDLLVRAFAAVAAERPELDLVIAGPDEGGLIPDLSALARELGVADRIHWPGMLVGDAKWGAYRGAEAFVLPSHQENFGVVVAEALACGIPVLTTNKVNIWRDIEAMGAGFIREDNEDGVVDLLRVWSASSGLRRTEMASSARLLFQEKYSIGKISERFLEELRAA